MSEIAGKWGVSRDEELYRGDYLTRADAIAACDPNGSTWVGQFQEPPDPAGYIDHDLILEHILCQDEYSMEAAEGALEATKEELADLTQTMQAAFRDWMTRNSITPGFYMVDPDTVHKVQFDLDGHLITD